MSSELGVSRRDEESSNNVKEGFATGETTEGAYQMWNIEEALL